MDLNIPENIPEPDSKEALLLEYGSRKKERLDDAAAMQAVICIIIAAAMLVFAHFYPDTAKELLELIRLLSADSRELFPNPIEAVVSALDKL